MSLVPYGATGGLARLNRALLDLAEEADQLHEDGDKPTLAYALAEVREFRKAVSDLERHIEDHVGDLMEAKTENLDDEITLEKRMGKKRTKWDSLELLRHLVGDQLINPETGENVFETITACVPFTGSTGWRITALRDRGIDPSDWCSEEPGRPTVQVHVQKELPE